jgi:ketosteroid isomerase-like protein
MSEEQLEMVRETVRLLNAGDLDGLRQLLHPEIAMWGPTGWPESGPMVDPTRSCGSSSA